MLLFNRGLQRILYGRIGQLGFNNSYDYDEGFALIFALLYLRFTIWWLDLNLLSGPDALQKGRS